MINGVDMTGNQEDLVDLESSKMPEKEAINQKGLNKKDTDGSNKDTESKPEVDQASKKRGKEADSAEPMAGLAHKRATRETSVAGSSSLGSPPVSCSDSTASGHLVLPGPSTPGMKTLVKMVRQIGPSGVVDWFKGEVSHEVEFFRSLELDIAETKRVINGLAFYIKEYYEMNNVFRRELARCEYESCDPADEEQIPILEKKLANTKSWIEELELCLGVMAVRSERNEKSVAELRRKHLEFQKKIVDFEVPLEAYLASLAL